MAAFSEGTRCAVGLQNGAIMVGTLATSSGSAMTTSGIGLWLDDAGWEPKGRTPLGTVFVPWTAVLFVREADA